MLFFFQFLLDSKHEKCDCKFWSRFSFWHSYFWHDSNLILIKFWNFLLFNNVFKMNVNKTKKNNLIKHGSRLAQVQMNLINDSFRVVLPKTKNYVFLQHFIQVLSSFWPNTISNQTCVCTYIRQLHIQLKRCTLILLNYK